jgi:hypothetical protein
MYIPEMRPGMKSRIQNAQIVTPLLLSDRVTVFRLIPLSMVSVTNVEIKLMGSGTEKFYNLVNIR